LRDFSKTGSLPGGFFDGGLLVAVPPPEPALGGRLVVAAAAAATDMEHHAAARAAASVVEGVVGSPCGAAAATGVDRQLKVHGGRQERRDARRGRAAGGRAPGARPGALRHSLDVEPQVVWVVVLLVRLLVVVLRSPSRRRRLLRLVLLRLRRRGLVVVVLLVEELEVVVVPRGGGLVQQLLREGCLRGGAEVGEVRRHVRRVVVVLRRQGVVVQRLVPEGPAKLLGGGGLGRLRLLRRRGHGEAAVHDELLELGDAAVAGLHGDARPGRATVAVLIGGTLTPSEVADFHSFSSGGQLPLHDLGGDGEACLAWLHAAAGRQAGNKLSSFTSLHSPELQVGNGNAQRSQ
jgi:hypothetical protein